MWAAEPFVDRTSINSFGTCITSFNSLLSDFLRYLTKGGSLLGCSFGGSMTVASLGVTTGSAEKRGNYRCNSLLYI